MPNRLRFWVPHAIIFKMAADMHCYKADHSFTGDWGEKRVRVFSREGTMKYFQLRLLLWTKRGKIKEAPIFTAQFDELPGFFWSSKRKKTANHRGHSCLPFITLLWERSEGDRCCTTCMTSAALWNVLLFLLTAAEHNNFWGEAISRVKHKRVKAWTQQKHTDLWPLYSGLDLPESNMLTNTRNKYEVILTIL